MKFGALFLAVGHGDLGFRGNVADGLHATQGDNQWDACAAVPQNLKQAIKKIMSEVDKVCAAAS
jgi:hypothetical protein